MKSLTPVAIATRMAHAVEWPVRCWLASRSRRLMTHTFTYGINSKLENRNVWILWCSKVKWHFFHYLQHQRRMITKSLTNSGQSLNSKKPLRNFLLALSLAEVWLIVGDPLLENLTSFSLWPTHPVEINKYRMKKWNGTSGSHIHVKPCLLSKLYQLECRVRKKWNRAAFQQLLSLRQDDPTT